MRHSRRTTKRFSFTSSLSRNEMKHYNLSKYKTTDAKTIHMVNRLSKLKDMSDERLFKYKSLPKSLYLILEDGNAHKLNSELTKRGKFGAFEEHVAPVTKEHYFVPVGPGWEKAQEEYVRYKKHGGLTWQ